MRSALLATSLLSMFFTVTAFAQTAPPPLPPIQIVTSDVIKPVQAAPTVTKKANGIAAVVSADQKKRSSDSESAADEARKEREFAAARKSSAGARTSTVPTIEVVKVAPLPVRSAPAQSAPLESVPAIVRVAPVRAAPVRVAAPSAVGGVRVTRRDDAASVIAERCKLLGKHVLRCLNREISDVETRADNNGTRTLNCAELRKIQKAGAPSAIDAFITGRLNSLKSKAETSLAVHLEEAGSQATKFEKHEIQLRASLAYFSGMSELASKVCSPHLFAEAFSSSGQ